MNRNIFSFLLVLAVPLVFAQEKLDFQKPSQEILQLADFERAPSVFTSPDKEFMIFAYRNTYKTLEDLSQEDMRLGGLRFNPKTHISSTITYLNNLKIQKLNSKDLQQVKNLPSNPQIGYLSFSPNEKMLSFTHTNSDTQQIELWYVDLNTAIAKKLATGLNAVTGRPYTWLNDNNRLLAYFLPQNVPAFIDKNNELPTGPIVSVATGQVSQTRTYQDLLSDPQDEENFKNAIRSELKMVNLNATTTPFLPTDLYVSESLSPDGNYFLIEKIVTPFSYVVPYSRFPRISNVYDLNAKLIKTLYEAPLDEIRPQGFSSTKKGMRSINWRADKAAEIIYAEALDEGDANKQVEYRDQIFTWAAPFDKPAVPLIKTKLRYGGIEWGNQDFAVLYESWYDTRMLRSTAFNPQNGKEIRVMSERNYQDSYSDPGNFYTQKNEFGRNVIYIKNNQAFLFGDGFTKDGQFPFIDQYNFNSNKTERLYTSNKKGKIESLITFIDEDKREVLTQVESPNEYPNYYRLNLKNKKSNSLTQFPNPFASIANVKKEIIHYKRNDGVDLSGILYLPANYNKNSGQKLPLLVWAYPTEYKDKSTAGQTTNNPDSFTYPYYGSFVYWVTKGYAVLDDASFPIIGEGDTEPNDSFIEQLLANGKAAIDALDARGIIDRERVAVGGHSYGAFMTANLLTHGDDFKCGIARSGAYNRTLTPFGFQSEQRNYWDNPDIYNTMSPFMNAHKMKKPMLIVHGEADNNPGTFTLQSERYFQALRNLGAPVRMVILPKESHGYAAKENILHLLWEQDQFLEECLKP
ncbi:MAG: prolyl oligopeptidase family serine peptidase [Flavobacteriaceae bacterium]|nr:prolyl oligopeptidase family serine peptidase [Flavobacteriaceae bacterium]